MLLWCRMTRINSLTDTVSQLRKGSREIQSRIQALAEHARGLVESFHRAAERTPHRAAERTPAATPTVPSTPQHQADPVERRDTAEQLTAQRDALTAELSARDEALTALREDLFRLRADRSVLEAEVTGLNATLAEGQDRHTEELAQDGPASDDALTALQDERQVLAIKVEVLSKQLEELERLREESALRKASDQEASDLRRQLAQLTEQNARLRSLELIRERPPQKLQSGGQAQLGSILDGVLANLAQRETGRGAVVADLSGLVVAADVSDPDSFAAMAAMLHQAGERAAKPLPLASARRLAVIDENELTVTVIPFRTETDELLLVTLTAGPGPSESHLSTLLAAASADD